MRPARTTAADHHRPIAGRGHRVPVRRDSSAQPAEPGAIGHIELPVVATTCWQPGTGLWMKKPQLTNSRPEEAPRSRSGCSNWSPRSPSGRRPRSRRWRIRFAYRSSTSPRPRHHYRTDSKCWSRCCWTTSGRSLPTRGGSSVPPDEGLRPAANVVSLEVAIPLQAFREPGVQPGHPRHGGDIPGFDDLVGLLCDSPPLRAGATDRNDIADVQIGGLRQEWWTVWVALSFAIKPVLGVACTALEVTLTHGKVPEPLPPVPPPLEPAAPVTHIRSSRHLGLLQGAIAVAVETGLDEGCPHLGTDPRCQRRGPG